MTKTRYSGLKVEIEFDQKRVDRVLAQLPVLAQLAAFEGGLRPAAKVVADRVKAKVPRSSETGSTKLWSKKTKSSRSGERPLADVVAIKMLKGRNFTESFITSGPTGRASALVGFLWPDGNKGHLLVPYKKETRRKILWGRDTNQEVDKGYDFLREAFDETRQQQGRAFTYGVIKAVRRKLRDLGRG